MLVETRREDFAPAQAEAADQGGAALRDLIAAALVSHEAIGDPDRLAGGEAAALRALCRHVAGPVYRIAPFHYAFAAGAEAAASLVARLAAELGPDALWIAALDHLAAPAEAAEGPAPAALLVLQARETAVVAGLAAAGPDLQAVIDARYAVECARLTAEASGVLGASMADTLGGALGGALGEAVAARLEGIEARIAVLADEAARSHAASAERAAAEAAAIRDAAERAAEKAAEKAAERIVGEAVAARLSALADFETRVGLALAEFLARLERRESEAGLASEGAPEFAQGARRETGAEAGGGIGAGIAGGIAGGIGAEALAGVGFGR